MCPTPAHVAPAFATNRSCGQPPRISELPFLQEVYHTCVTPPVVSDMWFLALSTFHDAAHVVNQTNLENCYRSDSSFTSRRIPATIEAPLVKKMDSISWLESW